jgi:hypothetical protein
MKKLKVFCSIIIGLVLFSSCSEDNESTDIIVGRWRAIQMLEMNLIVEMPVCLPYTYIEYKADNSAVGGNIISPDFPEECNLVSFDFARWENLGNSQYRIYPVNQQGTISKIYKESENLVIESLDGNSKLIYEAY